MADIVILVLDDDKDIQKMWKETEGEYNKGEGKKSEVSIECKPAYNNEEALNELLTNHEISVMVLDRKLTHSDGAIKSKDRVLVGQPEEGDTFREFAEKYVSMPIIVYSALSKEELTADEKELNEEDGLGEEERGINKSEEISEEEKKEKKKAELLFSKNLPKVQLNKQDFEPMDIIRLIVLYHQLGALNILSNSGRINKLTHDFFMFHFPVGKKYWQEETIKKTITEDPIVRFLAAYIQEELAIDENTQDLANFHSPEMYMPSSDAEKYPIGTGDIIFIPNEDTENPNAGSYYIVLTPQCDLALYKGLRKADFVLVAKIIPFSSTIKASAARYYKLKYLPKVFDKLTPKGYDQDCLCIDFQQITTFEYSTIQSCKKTTKYKIANAFLREITSKFGQLYGRQGQPNV